MTPKEKATELYQKYYQMVLDNPHPEFDAKQSAIKMIDHKLKRVSILYRSELNYWNQVKEEIENL